MQKARRSELPCYSSQRHKNPCYLRGVLSQILMNAHAICMVPPLSEPVALRMSKDRIAEFLLSELSLLSAASPDPCYLHSVLDQSIA